MSLEDTIFRKLEDTLIDMRDSRIGFPFAANGLVVREADGKDSSVIRMTTRDVVRFVLREAAEQAGGGE